MNKGERGMMMKKFFLFLLIIFSFILTGCNDNENKDNEDNPDEITQSVSFNNDLVSLEVDDHWEIVVTLEGCEKEAIEFSLSKENVVEIVEDEIVAIKDGNVTLTATITGSDISDSIEIEVSLKPKENPNLHLDKTDVYINEQFTIEISNYENNSDFNWTSTNPEIITIDENGKITPLSEGTAIITASLKEDETKISSITLTCIGIETGEDPNIEIEKTKIEINERIPINISNYSNNDDFLWELTDPTIISISEDYIVTPLKEGIVTLFVYKKTNEEITAAISITIYKIPTEIPEITTINSVIEVGKKTRIDIANYRDKNDFKWEVSDETIISLNSAYSALGLKPGNVTITITHKDFPELTNSFVLKVIPIQPILGATSDLIKIGSQTLLTILNKDEIGVNNDDFEWSVSNSEIFTIDENYTVTALNEGTATVSIVAKDILDLSASFDITVVSGSNGNDLILYTDDFDATVQAGEFYQVYIDGVDDNSLYNWQSMDTSIITVNENGRVIAVKAGRAQLVAYSKDDPNIKGSIYITVVGEPNVDYIGRLLKIALEQEGYREGPNNSTKYASWYGLPNEAWCAMFVTWCAFEAGIGNDIIPRYAGVSAGKFWFETKGLFKVKEDYIPKPGDLIFFLSNGASHTGIVTRFDGERVYTIEGNTSNMVAQRSYLLNHYTITGYGTPEYPPFDGESTEVDTGNATDGSNETTE